MGGLRVGIGSLVWDFRLMVITWVGKCGCVRIDLGALVFGVRAWRGMFVLGFT